MIKSTYSFKFFTIFIIIWVLFSVLRTIYNDSKLFTQDSHLFFLSQENKQKEIYGDISEIVKQIPIITRGEPFLITGNDGGLYFYLRYLLYPQKVYWVNNTTISDKKRQPWRFVFRPYMSLPKNKQNTSEIVDPVTRKKLGIITKL